jgi:hypothetical protein
MKTLARRRFLQQLCGFVGLAPSTGGICSPAVLKRHKRRISQRELEDAAVQHAAWLNDASRGARAVFSDCDLSGLDLLSHEPEIIDLRGSDFTAADLSGASANQISFHRASLQSARLSWSQLKLPIFCGATLRRALCNDVVWGWPSPFVLTPPPSCGEADAYWADSYQIDGDRYVAIITDPRLDEPLHRRHIDIGTKFVVPNHKLKYEASNPTGHGIIFLNPYDFVLCYLPPGGV